MSTPSLPREMTAHNNLHSLLFQTTSAEYIALCVQTYQLARHAMMEKIGDGTYRNPAIILDLDETVLDNSAYQKWQIAAGANFHEPTSWRKWCDGGAAGAVPGALEFVRFVEENGVTPIFITSREDLTRKGTAKNLFALGLLSQEEYELEAAYDPATGLHEHASQTRLFMKKMGQVSVPQPSGAQTYDLNNKFEQRVFCERFRGYEILLSIGDNLGDYAEYYGRIFDKDGNRVDGHPSIAGRRSAVWQDIRLFGREFILLPNATYGSWLRACEANGLGASDELADTGEPVRKPLEEPISPFHYVQESGKEKTATATGTKLDQVPGKWTN